MPPPLQRPAGSGGHSRLPAIGRAFCPRRGAGSAGDGAAGTAGGGVSPASGRALGSVPAGCGAGRSLWVCKAASLMMISLQTAPVQRSRRYARGHRLFIWSVDSRDCVNLWRYTVCNGARSRALALDEAGPMTAEAGRLRAVMWPPGEIVLRSCSKRGKHSDGRTRLQSESPAATRSAIT